MTRDPDALVNRLLGDLRTVPAQRPARVVPFRPMEPVPAHSQQDVSRAYWYGWSDVVPVPEDRTTNDRLYITKTAEQLPPSAEPDQPAWAVTTYPMWNRMPFWGKPFEFNFEACIPTWEQDYVIGRMPVGQMEMAIIRGMSYHVPNGLAQYDVFEIALFRNSELRIRIEDMIIDPTTGDPSHRYVFAADARQPMPIWDHVDRNQTLVITAKARGLVAFGGTSNHSPGDPLTPNASIRVSIIGYMAPLRKDVDGGPRPTDQGNELFVSLDQDRKWIGV